MINAPLDLSAFRAVSDRGRIEPVRPPELGHIHLQVRDLCAAERFYCEFLGLAVSQTCLPGTLFLAVGDYHHHLAVSTCADKEGLPANAVGLMSYRFEVPVAEILYCLDHRAPLIGYETRTLRSEDKGPILQIRDPNGTWLEIQPSTSRTGTKRRCAVQSFAAKVSARLHL